MAEGLEDERVRGLSRHWYEQVKAGNDYPIQTAYVVTTNSGKSMSTVMQSLCSGTAETPSHVHRSGVTMDGQVNQRYPKVLVRHEYNRMIVSLESKARFMETAY